MIIFFEVSKGFAHEPLNAMRRAIIWLSSIIGQLNLIVRDSDSVVFMSRDGMNMLIGNIR